MSHFYPPPYEPFFYPYQYNNPFPPHYYQNRPPYRSSHQRPYFSPRYSAAIDAEVIAEADELLEQIIEEEEWMSDGERARTRGEVIDGPRKSAAAYPSDMYEDENKFRGRKPGQPVNGEGSSSSSSAGGEVRDGGSRFENRPPSVPPPPIMEDPREQHVILDDFDDYANDFFRHAPPIPPPRPPQQQQRRSGPSVYTAEEEDLIAAMGGRHRAVDPEQQYDGPQGPHFVPPPPQQQNFREEGFLGDSTLKEISLDYSVPIPYLADVIAGWGAPVPIDPLARLGDMVTGEQAFAILEAIHTLDIAGLHERYSEDNLMNICDYYDIGIKDAFEFCMARGWALPFGVRTFLRVEQEEELLDALG